VDNRQDPDTILEEIRHWRQQCAKRYGGQGYPDEFGENH